jgi:hypothetical protein
MIFEIQMVGFCRRAQSRHKFFLKKNNKISNFACPSNFLEQIVLIFLMGRREMMGNGCQRG